MDRKQAIMVVESLPSLYPSMNADEEEAIWTILKIVTETDHAEDCISRQQAIADAQSWVAVNGFEKKMQNEVIEWLKEFPTAQPEQDWIPVSVRMPEEREWVGTKQFGTTISDEVYVTFETHNGERFTEHISFQNGKVPSFKQREIGVWHGGAVPIAWKPKPEPWKGGAE